MLVCRTHGDGTSREQYTLALRVTNLVIIPFPPVGNEADLMRWAL
jgi:hypothetical protein